MGVNSANRPWFTAADQAKLNVHLELLGNAATGMNEVCPQQFVERVIDETAGRVVDGHDPGGSLTGFHRLKHFTHGGFSFETGMLAKPLERDLVGETAGRSEVSDHGSMRKHSVLSTHSFIPPSTTGYAPNTFTERACLRSRPTAFFGRGSSMCPEISRTKLNSFSPRCVGRDSMRVMLMPVSLITWMASCKAPTRLGSVNISEVLSRPVANVIALP